VDSSKRLLVRIRPHDKEGSCNHSQQLNEKVAEPITVRRSFKRIEILSEKVVPFKNPAQWPTSNS
jgi:hypothetical protein